MRLLLGTHTFLWFAAGDKRLPAAIRELIADGTNDAYVSIVSLWEMAIKVGTGKLQIAEPLDIFVPKELQRNRLELLPIVFPHIARVATLPFHHRDPFDRLLIAQSMVELLPIVIVDNWFDSYDITRPW